MVIDDQVENVTLVTRVMRDAGFTSVAGETNPEKALISIHDIAPNLIILDQHMPIMSGFQFLTELHRLRADGPYIPVLMLTADVTDATKHEALRLGVEDFLQKPFDAVELLLRTLNILSASHIRKELELENADLTDKLRKRAKELEELNAELEVEIQVRKQTEQELMRAEGRNRYLLSACPTTIYAATARPPYRLNFIAETVRSMLGYTAQEIINGEFPPKSLIHRDDLARVLLALDSLDEVEKKTEIYRLRNAEGEYRWIRDDMVMIAGVDGRPFEIIGSWVDITDQRLAEESLTRRSFELAETNTDLLDIDRLKSAMVASTSKELHQPLAVIREFAREYRPSGTPGKRMTTYQSKVLRNCDEVTKLVEALVEIQGIESGMFQLEPRRTDIASVLHESVRVFEIETAKDGVVLNAQVPPDLPDVFADDEAIAQILTRLFENVALSTPVQGAIQFRASVDKTHVTIEITNPGRRLRAKELDQLLRPLGNIEGIDPSELTSSAVGLRISKRLVERLGGDLKIEAEPQRGLRASVSFLIWSPETEATWQPFRHGMSSRN